MLECRYLYLLGYRLSYLRKESQIYIDSRKTCISFFLKEHLDTEGDGEWVIPIGLCQTKGRASISATKRVPLPKSSYCHFPASRKKGEKKMEGMWVFLRAWYASGIYHLCSPAGQNWFRWSHLVTCRLRNVVSSWENKSPTKICVSWVEFVEVDLLWHYCDIIFRTPYLHWLLPRPRERESYKLIYFILLFLTLVKDRSAPDR